ncbi:ATP-binding protein [Flavobacterium sp. 3HN19-14]|uniref:ATP-binding protein n=1 Tax=Flavobacterium sp. 3HN19-14 TaxID=3448133 RepID=UPI003EDFDB77
MRCRFDIRYHEISFIDNGIGFDAAEGENLFSIFYRLHDRNHYKGSGIGLAVCRKIMALHGGYITAEGEKGKGATITCYFPAEAEQVL